MRFSVIVPVHNSEAYLHRSLDSLVSQSYIPYEVILVNDHSTDKSREICEKYAEEYAFIYVVDSSGIGVSAARNTGLGLASGEIITFCDADDFEEKDAFEAVNNIFLKNKEVSVVVTGYYDVEEASLSKLKLNAVNSFSQGIYSAEEVACHVLYDGNFMGSVWNKFFRRESIRDIHFDTNLSMCEDAHFVVQVLTATYNREACVYVSSIPTYNYVQNLSSASRSINKIFNKNGISNFSIAYSRIADLPTVTPKIRKVADYVNFKSSANFWIRRDIPKKYKPELMKNCRRKRKAFIQLFKLDKWNNFKMVIRLCIAAVS